MQSRAALVTVNYGNANSVHSVVQPGCIASV